MTSFVLLLGEINVLLSRNINDVRPSLVPFLHSTDPPTFFEFDSMIQNVFISLFPPMLF